jgi:hypothetical protein
MVAILNFLRDSQFPTRKFYESMANCLSESEWIGKDEEGGRGLHFWLMLLLKELVR